MGMYSYYDYDSIEVTDWKGLKEYLELFKSIKKGGSWDVWYNKIIPKMVDIKEKEPNLSFECWDDIKLISYWYNEYIIFFDGLAKYIEGEVRWTFENSDEAGYITFEDGKCMIHTGQITWSSSSTKDNIVMKELTKDMKKLLLLNTLEQK